MSERSGPGRSEGELDPEAGPVQRFAAELRALRESAGRPTYRVMAEKTPYGVTTLSQAAAGRQLPTRTVALAYVKACGGDIVEWEQRWQKAWSDSVEDLSQREPSRPPYRGLVRFEPADAALFFGRDTLVERLTELNRKHRFTAVFGPSGSGKSSLLRAGLIPRLREPAEGGDAPPEAPPAAVRILTPGPDPLGTHAERLQPVEGSDADTWLIVDQFEELYTLGSAPVARDAFIDRLLTAAEADSRLRVVIAVRADFLGRCAEHPGLTAALQDATLLVGPMSRSELREAIVRPAAADGLIVERALTRRLLDEVEGAPGGLPMMSHALLETWHHRRGRRLTEAAYEAAGGLHGAVVRTAEQVYGELTGAQPELARRVLLRLITPGEESPLFAEGGAPGGGTPDTRRPAAREELDFGSPDDTRTVLERLARARLITVDDGTVDLAHEALISSWPRLRAWLDAERDRLRVHRALSEAARTWQELGRENAALYAGSRLSAARDAFPPPAGPEGGGVDELTGAEREFLTASLGRRHRAVQLRRTVVSVLTALVLIATGTAFAALQARGTARSERDDAVFGRLTAEADAVRDTRSGLAARLDVAGQRMRATPELRSRLASDAGRTLATRLPGHRGVGTAVAYTPDGRTLATGGHDGTVRLWDTAPRPGSAQRPDDVGRALTRPLKLGAGRAGAVAVSPAGGDRLAAAGDDGALQVWDLSDRERPRRTGAPVRTHEEKHISSAAFAPDGETLATAGDDGKVRLWDVSGDGRPRPLGKPREADGSDTGSARDVAFSPDGKSLATAGYDGTVRLWRFDGDDGLEADGEPLRAHPEPVWTVAFSPDGATLATGGYDDKVRLWDVSGDGRPRPLGDPLAGHTSAVLSVAFSPDGKTLATVGEDNSPILWNVANPEYPLQSGEPLTGHTDAVWDVAFAPGGRTLATTGADRSVRLWHRPPSVLTDFTNPLTGVAYRPDGRVLAVASTDDALVRLWRVDGAGRPRGGPRHLAGHEGKVLAVAFAADGRTLASGSDDGTVRLWRVTASGKAAPLGEPLDTGEDVHSVAFSPDGRSLAAGGGDGSVRLWDARDPGRIRPAGKPLRRHTDIVKSLAFTRDGKTLATGSEDDTARLWHVGKGSRARPAGEALTAHHQFVNAVAFAPDGKTLATGSEDRTVRLWDVRDPGRVRPVGEKLTRHRGPIRAVAFAPDGKTLATGGSDRTVRLWDVADPARSEPLGEELTGHVDTVTTLEFSPDGRTLASGSYDLTARVWTLEADRAADFVCDRTGGVLTRSEWKEHLPQLAYRRACDED